jgi:hypothetical protein
MNTREQYNKLIDKLPSNVNILTVLYPDREKYENNLPMVDYPELKNLMDLRSLKGFKYYNNLRENEHHITIDSSFHATDLILNKLFGRGILNNAIEFEPINYEFTHSFKTWFPDKYDFLVYQPRELGHYKYFDFINNYNGDWTQCCSYNRPRGHWKNQYTPYHRYFTGSHRVGSIFNLDSKSNRVITIVADSFGIPIIPYLAYFAKQVNFYDNRSNGPMNLNIKNCTDFVFLCYERSLYDDNNAFYRSLKLAVY